MTHKFKTVLCPIDFSTDALTALSYAASVARQNDGQLILLHVVDDPLADVYGPRRQNFYAEVENAMEKSQEILADAARAHAAGVPCETLVKRGNPHEEILNQAASQHADLIVIGSVAEKVVRTAPCPVLTVRPGVQ
jgi:universal stress protein A